MPSEHGFYKVSMIVSKSEFERINNQDPSFLSDYPVVYKADDLSNTELRTLLYDSLLDCRLTKIGRIKIVRNITNLGLKSAKDIVDRVMQPKEDQLICDIRIAKSEFDQAERNLVQANHNYDSFLPEYDVVNSIVDELLPLTTLSETEPETEPEDSHF